MAAVAMWRRAVDNEGNDPEGDSADHLRMETVDAVSGRLARPERRAANEELVAALILLLIYAWICAKYRAQIGVFDRTCAKFPQNAATLYFGARFALTRVLWAFHEERGQYADTEPECQMNSPPSLSEVRN